MAVMLRLNDNDTDSDIYIQGTITRQPTRDGKVHFDDVIFGVLPGEELKITFSTDPKTSIISLDLRIDECDNDQVLLKRDNLYYCLDEREPDDIASILVYIGKFLLFSFFTSSCFSVNFLRSSTLHPTLGVALVLALAIIVLILLIWKRAEKPINNATPSMCYTIVIGVIFCAVSVAMWTKAADATCALRGWLLALGLTMIFGSFPFSFSFSFQIRSLSHLLSLGAIFVRAYRLLWVFKQIESDINSKESRRRVITNVDLGIGTGVLLVVVLIVLIVWMAVAPPDRKDVIEIDVSGKKADNSITYECNRDFPSSVFIITLIVIEALLLGFNCLVAFLTRNISSNFNESKHVAFAVSPSCFLLLAFSSCFSSRFSLLVPPSFRLYFL
jgi:NADH:ubiquinone oxidoreductase subunit 6 (subunit J)